VISNPALRRLLPGPAVVAVSWLATPGTRGTWVAVAAYPLPSVLGTFLFGRLLARC
jgi:hypothetical protein